VAASDADLVLLVIDGSRQTTSEDRQFLSSFPAALRVWNKSDLGDAGSVEAGADAIRVSAKTGEGMDRLIREIVPALIPALPPRDLAYPVAEEHFRWLEQAEADD
jgi:tRNA U34 5-carboxymethylaminomethyl modifying GTPase MnmE/TrmE